MELHEALFSALGYLFDLPYETKVQNKSDKPFFGYLGDQPMIPLYERMAIEVTNTYKGVKSFTNAMWPSGNLGFW